MSKFTLDRVLVLMNTRLKIWESERSKGSRDVCLIASICDIKDSIKTIEKAIRIQENYSEQFGGIFDE